MIRGIMDSPSRFSPERTLAEPSGFASRLRAAGADVSGLIRDTVREVNLATVSERGPRQADGLFLEDAVLPGANLSSANLEGLEARGGFFRRARFDGSILRRARFVNAVLMEAQLERADAREATFETASLQRANMRQINAQTANFTGANLAGADLQHADLRGANFAGCVWTGIDAYGATFDKETILPNGLTFETFVRECLPTLLTAGGVPLEKIIRRTEWERSYAGRLLYVAFGPRNEAKPYERRAYGNSTFYDFDIPARVVGDLELFLTLFKAGAIPFTMAQELLPKP